MSTSNDDRTVVPPADPPVVTDETMAAPAAIGGGAPRRHSPAEELSRGDVVGRYVVLSRLGAGAMGVVYAAYDPELDRRIALKLLRDDRGDDGTQASEGRVRLLREAQAMAQLVHPNVITVHDVGTIDQRVFVAMELVEGGTLHDRMRAHEGAAPSVDQTLAWFLAAGRGLYAAHAKGLVHRDFKPDNVLVADDGRVLVTDFGLARTIEIDEDDRRQIRSSPGATTDALSISMTAPGAIMGTPAYMSPEQYLGRDVGPASDQFSFCVALYEALYGERPFRGETFATLAFQVAQGKVRDAPAGSRVPRWLRRVLLRGLAPHPDERWPSMHALLRELDHDAGARRRTLWLAGAVAVLLAGALAGGRASRAPSTPPCTGASEIAASVWSPARADAITRGFVALDRPYAEYAAGQVRARLDAYVAQWTAMHTQACADTHVHGAQSTQMLDLRMSCLRQRLDEVDALAALFEQADAPMVERAPVAAASLTPLARCADLEALQRPTAVPADPELREEVGRIRTEIARAQAARRAGRYEAGLHTAKAARERAQSLGFAPLLAEALACESDLLAKNGEHERAATATRAAMAQAIASDHASVLAEAWVDLLWREGVDLGRREVALASADLVAAAMEAAGREDLEGTRLNALGAIHFRTPDFAQAEDHFERAYAWFLDEGLSDDPTVGTLLNNLGSVMGAQGRFEEARDYLQRSLGFKRELYGEKHPLLAGTMQNLALAHLELGENDAATALLREAYEMQKLLLGAEHPAVAEAATELATQLARMFECEEALQLFAPALAVRERVFGPDSEEVAATLINYSICVAEEGELERALEMRERVLRIREAIYGSEHRKIAVVLNNLAEIRERQGELELARALDERSIAILEATLGADHYELVDPLISLGNVASKQKRWAEAGRHYARAIEIRRAVSGDQHVSLVDAAWGLGVARLRQGEAEPALEPLRQAEQLAAANNRPLAHARIRLDLVEALAQLGEREQARTLARTALADARGVEGLGDERAQLQRWLARHPE